MDQSIAAVVEHARAIAYKNAIAPSTSVPSKQRMRKREFYVCDRCDCTIGKPEDGLIIHGNIYVADPSCRGGLIGNNFPNVKPGDKIEVTDIKETVYCLTCFQAALDMRITKPVSPVKALSVPAKKGQKKEVVKDSTAIDTQVFLHELTNLDVSTSRTPTWERPDIPGF